MVSRDTKLQIGVVSVVIVFWVLLFGVIEPGPIASVAFVAAAYFVILAGAHLYLALAGNSAMIPVAARWRYVGLAAVVAAAVFLEGTVGNVQFGSVTLNKLLGGTFALAVAFYLVYEARVGYLASRQ
jgi:hypothetical protein